MLRTPSAAFDAARFSAWWSASGQNRDNFLCGTTQGGTNGGYGVICKLSRDRLTNEVLHHFGDGIEDGRQSNASLIEASDGVLYGTTLNGGKP